MATASVTNTFVASTSAVASEVNTNFSDLVSFANNQVIHKDGSKAFTANVDVGSNKLINVTDGTLSTDAVTKSQLDAVSAATIPTGAITMYGNASAPSGWLLCDGQAWSRATYSDLFAIIGTTFGVGDGSTTFNVPDFQDRFPAGVGADADSFAEALGNTGGQQDAIIPSHTHAITGDGAHSHTSVSLTVSGTAASTAGTDFLYSSTVTTTAALGASLSQPSSLGQIANHTHSVSGTATGTVGTGSSTHAHTAPNPAGHEAVTNKNLPPYLAINFIIKT